jgi:hypothetical protein
MPIKKLALLAVGKVAIKAGDDSSKFPLNTGISPAFACERRAKSIVARIAAVFM